MSEALRIVDADWSAASDRRELVAIREEVFVNEQDVPVEIELDDFDPVCRHLLAMAGDRAVGTARMRAGSADRNARVTLSACRHDSSSRARGGSVTIAR